MLVKASPLFYSNYIGDSNYGGYRGDSNYRGYNYIGYCLVGINKSGGRAVRPCRRCRANRP